MRRRTSTRIEAHRFEADRPISRRNHCSGIHGRKRPIPVGFECRRTVRLGRLLSARNSRISETPVHPPKCGGVSAVFQNRDPRSLHLRRGGRSESDPRSDTIPVRCTQSPNSQFSRDSTANSPITATGRNHTPEREMSVHTPIPFPTRAYRLNPFLDRCTKRSEPRFPSERHLFASQEKPEENHREYRDPPLGRQTD